jgi:hypothetical protein
LQFAYYRSLSPTQKIAIILDLTRTAERAALVGIRERHPHATEHEQQLRLAALKFGPELVLAAYGWDVRTEGW